MARGGNRRCTIANDRTQLLSCSARTLGWSHPGLVLYIERCPAKTLDSCRHTRPFPLRNCGQSILVAKGSLLRISKKREDSECLIRLSNPSW